MVDTIRVTLGIAIGVTIGSHGTSDNPLLTFIGFGIGIISIISWLRILGNQYTEFISLRYLALTVLPFGAWCITVVTAMAATLPEPFFTLPSIADLYALVMFVAVLIGDMWGSKTN